MEEHCSGNSVLGVAYFAGISEQPECNYEGKLIFLDNEDRKITGIWNVPLEKWDLIREGEKVPYKRIEHCEKIPEEIRIIKIPEPGKELLVKDLFYKIKQAQLNLLGIKLIFDEAISLLSEKTKQVWIEYFLVEKVIVARVKLNPEDDRFKLIAPENNFLSLGEITEIQLVLS